MTNNTTRRHFLKTAGMGAAAIAAAPWARSQTKPKTADRPNILFVFPDQYRPDWTSFNSTLGVRTPNLARLASGGMRFDRAYCPSPLCAPSRACLAQGKRYGRTGVPSNGANNPEGIRTFYQQLRDGGYRVGSVGKADLRKAAFDWGPDGWHRTAKGSYFQDWGFTDGFDSEGKGDAYFAMQRAPRDPSGRAQMNSPYACMLAGRRDDSLDVYQSWFRRWIAAGSEAERYAVTDPYSLSDEAYNDNWVGAGALNLLEKGFPRNQPWFLQVNFPGPHNPVDITRAMAPWYRDAEFPQPIDSHELSSEAHVRIRRNYSAMVENIDRWLGRFLEAVAARGESDRTLVIFSSDHGEMLGDHGRWAKKVPYEPSVAVPLIVKGPGVVPAKLQSGPTATLDLVATFLEAGGYGVLDEMDSRSLWPVLRGDQSAGRKTVSSALGAWRMVADGRFKLIEGFDTKAAYTEGASLPAPSPQKPETILFDLKEDPNELRNIAAAHPELVARLSTVAE